MPFGFSHLKISACWCFGECQVSSSIQHRTAGCHIGLKILQEAAESWPGQQDRQRKRMLKSPEEDPVATLPCFAAVLKPKWQSIFCVCSHEQMRERN